jgi:hypothetical protein
MQVLTQGGLDVDFENAVLPNLTPTVNRFIRLSNSTVAGGGEVDKEISMLSIENSTYGAMFEATGANLIFGRNSIFRSMSIAPRQLRLINSTINSTGNSYISSPLVIKGCWATEQVDLVGSTLRRDDGSNIPAVTQWPDESLRIGTDATWNGRVLTIPALSGNPFIAFACTMYAGGIVYSGPRSNWGYITQISGDANNVYATITWVSGTKPSNDQKIFFSRIHDFSMDSASKIVGAGLVWRDTGANRERVSSSLQAGVAREYPEGYPAGAYGFGGGDTTSLNPVDLHR